MTQKQIIQSAILVLSRTALFPGVLLMLKMFFSTTKDFAKMTSIKLTSAIYAIYPIGAIRLKVNTFFVSALPVQLLRMIERIRESLFLPEIYLNIFLMNTGRCSPQNRHFPFKDKTANLLQQSSGFYPNDSAGSTGTTGSTQRKISHRSRCDLALSGHTRSNARRGAVLC